MSFEHCDLCGERWVVHGTVCRPKKQDCKHDTMRCAKTMMVSSTEMRRMEWCESCGALLDDRTWPIPLAK